MAHGDGGVLGHQHHGCGLTNYQGAADDNGVLALAVNAVVIQNLHAGGGGAGRVAQGLAFKNAGIGHMGHGVHVLLGSQTVADLVLVSLQVLGQGTEHQNAVDGIVSVDLIDHSQDFFLGSGLGQNEVLHSNAHFLSALGSSLLVGKVRGVLAQTDDTQSGDNALLLQSGSACLQCSHQSLVDFLTQ